MSKKYSVYLIRMKSTFPETLRNLQKLITKSALIENLCVLLHYAKTHNIHHRNTNTLHTEKCIHSKLELLILTNCKNSCLIKKNNHLITFTRASSYKCFAFFTSKYIKFHTIDMFFFIINFNLTNNCATLSLSELICTPLY